MGTVVSLTTPTASGESVQQLVAGAGLVLPKCSPMNPLTRPTQTVFHTMAARFQTVACTSTRINMYPSSTSIPPTAAAFGCVGHLQILRLVSLSAPHAPLGQWNALTNARVGMGCFTSHSFLTIGSTT